MHIAYHVKAVPALADDDGTVIARELAFATGAFEVYAADTARVVGLFGQIPFPGGHGAEGVDGDLHFEAVEFASCIFVILLLLLLWAVAG